MSSMPVNYFDALHGEVSLDERIARLAATPVVQRLRHIRLSNVDSISMPGIANVSRYEHVLGVAYLASRVGLRRRVSEIDHLALMAAALLHDWAITAFGHLVEEAYHYLAFDIRHENKLDMLLHSDRGDGDTLGTELQILAGRQTGFSPWLRSVCVRHGESELLDRLGSLIMGKGHLGQLISGDMDLDNIDNVYRIAFHMGLPIDRGLPVRLVEAIIDVGDDGSPIFAISAGADISAWVETRRSVYRRLMPARPDFSFKLMIIWATIRQIEAGLLTKDDWKLVDSDFICCLSGPDAAPDARDTILRWKVGEVWDISPLWWLPGTRPSYVDLAAFSKELSAELQRHCFAYGIKDKRERQLNFRFDDGTSATFGSKPQSWLFGVGSSRRGAFSRAEINQIISKAVDRFAPTKRPTLAEDPMHLATEPALL
jgi:hypothetical protein